MMRWLFTRKPALTAQPTTSEPYRVARSDLTRRARRVLDEHHRKATLAALRADNAAGRTSPIAPRAEIVAGVHRW
jgi:hypothetical protein